MSTQRSAAKHRARLDSLVQRMYADYQRPMSLYQVGAKYDDRSPSCIRELFTRRGLEVRPFKLVARQPNGSPVRYVPMTDAQLEQLVSEATHFRVPIVLKFEWRRWDLRRRGEFIAKLRAKLKRKEDRPTTPFSDNLEPFDYASPRAHQIVARVNLGMDPHQDRQTLKIVCQGVIYNEQLWFWADKVGYALGFWDPEVGRPLLHHKIWSEHHGRDVPREGVIRYIDGNPNNIVGENLTLLTRNDVCRENQAAALLKQSRAMTSLLLKRSKAKEKNANISTLQTLHRARK